MEIREGMSWDGQIAFSILDGELVRRAGLLNDIPKLLQLIESGHFSFKRESKHKNKVTNYARQYLASVLANVATYPWVLPNYMELGTGTGTPAATDTNLWSPAAGTLQQCSYTQVYLTYYAQLVTAWQTSSAIQGTWSEIGLKDSNGNLWSHAAITSNLTVNPGEVLIGQWNVQLLGN